MGSIKDYCKNDFVQSHIILRWGFIEPTLTFHFLHHILSRPQQIQYLQICRIHQTAVQFRQVYLCRFFAVMPKSFAYHGGWDILQLPNCGVATVTYKNVRSEEHTSELQ